MHIILDANDEKSDLNKVMNKKNQHPESEECEIILSLLRIFEDMFGDTLGTWDTKPVDFDLKDYSKPVCSQP